MINIILLTGLIAQSLAWFELSAFNEYGYELGTNQIVNGYFSNPPQKYVYQYYLTYPNWTSNYAMRIDTCYAINQTLQWPCTFNYAALDIFMNENITQIIQLDKGYYVLSFNWGAPSSNYTTQAFRYWWNNIVIQFIIPINSTLNFRQVVVEATQGNNILMFQGLGTEDAIGADFGNISLQQMIFSDITYYEMTFADPTTAQNTQLYLSLLTKLMANTFPGSRVIVSCLTTLMYTTDHLYLYNYHNRRFSFYSLILIQNSLQIHKEKGTLFKSGLFDKFINFTQLRSAVDLQVEYTPKKFYQVRQIGIGLLPNVIQDLICENISCLLVWLSFGFIFTLLKKWKISILVKDYRFVGILFLMWIEGNVQFYSFHYFAQMNMLFSTRLSLKLVHLFAIIFFFFFFIGVLCFYLLLEWQYKHKKVKGFIEGMKNNFSTIVFLSRKGLFGILLGACHATAQNNQNVQLFFLIAIQSSNIICLITYLNSLIDKINLRIFFSIVLGLQRIAYLISFYKYDNNLSIRQQINLIHLYFLVAYLGLFMLFVISEMHYFIKESIRRMIKLCKSPNINRIVNLSSSSHKFTHQNSPILTTMPAEQPENTAEHVKFKDQMGQLTISQLNRDNLNQALEQIPLSELDDQEEIVPPPRRNRLMQTLYGNDMPTTTMRVVNHRVHLKALIK